MGKITVCVKMDKDLKEFLDKDALIIYNRDRQLSNHILNILQKYKETRPEKETCGDVIHEYRVKANDDNYCPICGEYLKGKDKD